MYVGRPVRANFANRIKTLRAHWDEIRGRLASDAIVAEFDRKDISPPGVAGHRDAAGDAGDLRRPGRIYRAGMPFLESCPLTNARHRPDLASSLIPRDDSERSGRIDVWQRIPAEVTQLAGRERGAPRTSATIYSAETCDGREHSGRSLAASKASTQAELAEDGQHSWQEPDRPLSPSFRTMKPRTTDDQHQKSPERGRGPLSSWIPTPPRKLMKPAEWEATTLYENGRPSARTSGGRSPKNTLADEARGRSRSSRKKRVWFSTPYRGFLRGLRRIPNSASAFLKRWTTLSLLCAHHD